MKKITLFLLALSATVMLTGCKKGPAETEPPATEPPVETEIHTEPPTTEAPTETEKEDSMNRTRELKGLVKSSDTSTLTIQTERGKELTFSITGADIQLANGIQAGANVTVLYKGKISGTDTSNARVLMVVDLQAGETPVTEGELMTEGEEADPEAGAGTIGGTIEDLSADRIVIVADDGESYYFSLYGTSINLVNGMKQGNYVTVDYNGDIHGPDLVPATRVADNDPNAGDASVAPGPSANSSQNSFVSGTIEECGLSATTITSDDGDTLSIDTSDATQYYKDGIAVGSYITIEYTGTLNGTDTTGVKAVAVYDYSGDGSGNTGGDTGASGEDTGAASGEDAGGEAGTPEPEAGVAGGEEGQQV